MRRRYNGPRSRRVGRSTRRERPPAILADARRGGRDGGCRRARLVRRAGSPVSARRRADPGGPRRAGRDQPARRPGSRALGRPAPARDGPPPGRSARADRRAPRRVRPRRRAGPTRRAPHHVRPVRAPPMAPTSRPGRRQGGPSDLGGEKKHVTILVAEVAGLTDSAHDFEPDLADRLQTSIVPLLVDVIHQCAGTVNRVGGDGIMAIFGAPLAREDDAVRACHAALALHAAFERFTRQPAWCSRARAGPPRGPGIQRRRAAQRQQRPGPGVHRARPGRPHRPPVSGRSPPAGPPCCRLRPCARPKGTSRFGRVGRRRLGVSPSAVGGIEAFELLGVQPAQTRFQRVVTTRQLTPFIGRDAELAALGLALGQAGAGRGQIVALVGEPGVGKSRLIWEATRSAWSDGWLVLESGAVAHGYRVLLRAGHRPASSVLSDRDPRRRPGRPREGDRAAAGAGSGASSRTCRPCSRCSTRPSMMPPGTRWTRPGAATGRWRPSSACCSGRARRRRCCSSSRISTGSTARPRRCWTRWWRACRRLACCCSCRTAPSTTHQWARKTYYGQLHVGALPSQRADELLGALLGDDAALHALRQHLIRKTEGNPLFLEESVRSLVDAGSPGRRARRLSPGADPSTRSGCPTPCRRCSARASTASTRRRSGCSSSRQ